MSGKSCGHSGRLSYRARRRSNSIPWCTSFNVILSLRTWHIKIIILQNVRNEHLSVRCIWFPNMFRFSSSCFWEYRVNLYSLCLKGAFQRYFEGLHVFHWSVENYLCARSQLQTQSMRLGNWKVHWENRNHDWSKKWLQQNSRYAVKVITKGGFISASRSKDLNLQLQLQIKFNLSMPQTILSSESTRCWLTQSSRKFPGQNTDLFFWINKVSDIFFFNFWAGLFSVVPRCAACMLRGTFVWVPITLKHTVIFTAPCSN